jgi:hypothetical protein
MSFKLFIPSLLHLLVDFFSIYLLLSLKVDANIMVIMVILYDCLAFMSQPIIGALIEKSKKLNDLISISLVIVLVAQLIPIYYISIPLVAIGNALFHVSAGKLVIDKSVKSSPLGIFISFGVLGVGFATNFHNEYLYVILIALYIVLLLVNEVIDYNTIENTYIKDDNNEKTYIFPAILITFGVILRGFFGYYNDSTVVSTIQNGPIIIVLVVFFGKFIGGFLIDKFKMIPIILLSTILSVLGIIYSANFYAYLIGIFGVNLLMALTLELIRRVLPNARAFGFGLLASGLSLGSILGMFLKSNSPYVYYVNIILVLINLITLLVTLIIYKKKKGILL